MRNSDYEWHKGFEAARLASTIPASLTALGLPPALRCLVATCFPSSTCRRRRRRRRLLEHAIDIVRAGGW